MGQLGGKRLAFDCPGPSARDRIGVVGQRNPDAQPRAYRELAEALAWLNRPDRPHGQPDEIDPPIGLVHRSREAVYIEHGISSRSSAF
jgi:hypothetical protein